MIIGLKYNSITEKAKIKIFGSDFNRGGGTIKTFKNSDFRITSAGSPEYSSRQKKLYVWGLSERHDNQLFSMNKKSFIEIIRCLEKG